MKLSKIIEATKQELVKLGFMYIDGRINNLKLTYKNLYQTETGWNTACEVYFNKESCCIIGEYTIFFFNDNNWNIKLLKQVKNKLAKENNN